MSDKEIVIRRTEVCFGDARLSLCRITHRLPRPEEQRMAGLIHQHAYYELHLIESGSTVFSVFHPQESDGESVVIKTPVQGGELFIIPPDRGHYPFMAAEGCRETVFSLMLEKAEGETGFYDCFSDALNRSSCRPIQLPGKLFSEWLAFSHSFEGSTVLAQCRHKTKAYRLVTELFEQMDNVANQKTTGSPSHSEWERLIALDSMISSFLPLTDIARNLGYTTRHTARIIRQRYGKCLRELRYENMLMTAKSILRHSPKIPLATAARMAGFPDSAAMRNAFLRLEGILPTEYRDNITGEQPSAPAKEERNSQ